MPKSIKIVPPPQLLYILNIRLIKQATVINHHMEDLWKLGRLTRARGEKFIGSHEEVYIGSDQKQLVGCKSGVL